MVEKEAMVMHVDSMISSSFQQKLDEVSFSLNKKTISCLQVNVGKLCNQSCLHCHVEAGPNKKRENMDKKTFDRLLTLLKESDEIQTVDITGGAPELNPHFRFFVQECRALGKTVIDRCNLTVLFEKGQEDTARFLSEHQIKVVASLPCYSSENVEKQRGDGVFAKSIEALQLLNHLGYGVKDSGLEIDLVYNPIGATLPPPQSELEAEYKLRLREDFNIVFNKLFVITNMPIKRFLYDLKVTKQYQPYMTLLRENFNPAALDDLMCRSFLSISWDGKIYDCDFNQMLNLTSTIKSKPSIWEVESFQDYVASQVAVADHCFGCTAGAGSSCRGSLLN